jgi:ligand-binding sensor domain-containing protein/serine phosphatase RsbU (regulator of sigma subunit)
MQRRLFFFLVMLSCVCIAAAWAQEGGQVVIPLSDEYIKEWLVLGPFFPNDLEMDFLADVGGEANIRPYEGMSLKAPDGKSRNWKRYKSESDLINLQDALEYSEPGNAIAYVACNLLSPKAQRLEMVIERFDSVKVWLNGSLAHTTPKRNRWDTERFGISLKEGENFCLIKVRQYIGGVEAQWGFNARVLDYDAYLRSLELKLTVRRQNPDGRDELIISARRDPQSAVWELHPLPVHIEIRDEVSQLLANLKVQEGKSAVWAVPEEVQGTIRILAKQTDSSGKTHEARFTCRAHSIAPVTPQVGHWQTYDVTDGLGGSDVTSIIQDKDGDLWFGLSEGGISRYDGRTFRTFTTKDGLPINNVRTVFEDSRDNLWFGTMEYFSEKGAGVCRYDGKSFQTFTTKDGLADDAIMAIYEDDQGNMWFGTLNGGASKFDGTRFQNYTKENGLLSNLVGDITQDKAGKLWFGHGFEWGYGATRYDGRSFTHFTTRDGLAHNAVASITADAHGNLWFGTLGGVSKYDGKAFKNLIIAERLSGAVCDVFQTKDGDIWFATWSGVIRYRDGELLSFTAKEGLAHDWTMCITEDREGNLWFGTDMSGASRYDRSVQNIPVAITANRSLIRDEKGNLWFTVSGIGLGRYDGESMQTFAAEDGLPEAEVRPIYEDSRGNIWIGTFGGLARYDGERFQTFTHKDGLSFDWIGVVYIDNHGLVWIGSQSSGGVCTYDGAKSVQVAGKDELGGNDFIGDITQDADGNMWFSVIGVGLCKYDGKAFTHFTARDGLPSDKGFCLLADSKGSVWFGTEGGGVCRYDGKGFRTFTVEDGLASNFLQAIFEDSQGNLWFGTKAGGVSKFDGRNFQTLTTDSGLLSNTVLAIKEDENGDMLFGTAGGITIYTPPKEKIPPPVIVTEVVADEVYPAPVGATHASPLQIPSTTPRISFAYHGMSFKTKRMRYNYMLEGHDADWQATRDEEASYENLKPGDYVFKVIAINRDLVYSEAPATVHLAIVPPLYLRAVFLVPTASFATILLATLVILATALIKRRRQVHAYQQAAVRELQDAREMQMSLLPESPPPMEGFDIAGFSRPAREVGGDFFDYLSVGDGRIGITLADISGKGLKGAMNAVMTDGMLHEVATIEESCGKILSRLNTGLYSLIEKRTFVALELAILEQDSMKLQWANAAQPYPIVKRGEQVFESKSDSELPLGMMPNTSYPDWELDLQSGDIVVFYTDGIIEAENEAEEMYGTERLEQVITRINPAMNAEEIIETILQDVTGFAGTAEQYDDMTVVVVKKV